MPDNSVDSVVTDPPYGLTGLSRKKVEKTLGAWLCGDREFIPGGAGFMNQAWDRFVPPPALWDEALRVLKPGGFLLSFSGARTLDLMTFSIRLAGFDVRDPLMWARSDVFAKTKHALSPGYEPLVFAQKPCEGTIAQNIDRWGTGGLNIDACRTPYRNAADEAETKTKNAHGKFGTLNGGNAVYGTYAATERADYNPPGRLPKTLILDDGAAELMDEMNPVTRSRQGKPRTATAGEGWGMTATGAEHDDVGGPSRFFPSFHYAGRAPAKERPVGEDGTKHPTVKPVSLMEWAVELVTPAGGKVLDMFGGSGTTAEAAIARGRDYLLIEGQEKFIPLIEQRIARAVAP